MTEPLVPIEVDLRNFETMPLRVQALRDADFTAISTAEEFRAAMMLWCAAWHQLPAASLPNDDRLLCKLAGYGRDLKAWGAVRERAMHNFVLCSDDRWYHPTIADLALNAWERKRRDDDRTRHATEARRQRNGAKSNGAANHDDNRDDKPSMNVTKENPPTSRPPREGKGIEQKGKEGSVEEGDGADVRNAFDTWNDTASSIGLPVATSLSLHRQKGIRRRLSECGGIQGWLRALDKVAASDFLKGRNQQGWKADLDFILQPRSFTKLMEGSYDNRQPAGNDRSNLSELVKFIGERQATSDADPAG